MLHARDRDEGDMPPVRRPGRGASPYRCEAAFPKEEIPRGAKRGRGGHGDNERCRSHHEETPTTAPAHPLLARVFALHRTCQPGGRSPLRVCARTGSPNTEMPKEV